MKKYLESNIMRFRLKKQSRTLDLMDEFVISDKCFLTLSDVYLFLANQNGKKFWISISLILMRYGYDFDVIDTNIVISDLKKELRMAINVTTFESAARKRHIPLIEEILSYNLNEMNLPNTIFFSHPIKMGAQISSDKYFAYEKKRYGETTDFAIVGIEVQRY